jgi:hypothetical protein
MSVSLAERFVCRLLRIQQMTSAAANKPEPTTAPATIPAMGPPASPVVVCLTGAGTVERSVGLLPVEVVTFVRTSLGGAILGGEVFTLGFSAHSSPTLTSRVSVVALACHRVHVSASKSTMMYAAEKNGLPIIETSFTLSLDVGANKIPGADESVLKAPSDATYSRGRIRISFDSVNFEVPSRTRDRSPP